MERIIVDNQRTGEFLAALRKASGYTQQEVADYLGITNKTVSKWESGAGMPEIGILPAVAQLYQVSVDEILAGKRLEGKNPEDTAARRRWLLAAQEKRQRNGLIVIWCTVIAGYAVVFGLYHGLYNTGYSWITATCGVVFLLLEVMGIGLFYNQLRHNILMVSQEQQESQQELRLRLHSCRMKLILPLILAVAAVQPIVWQEIYILPASLPAPFGEILAAENMDALKQLYAQEIGSYFSVTLEGLQMGLRLNEKSMLCLLPIPLLAGSAVWFIIRMAGVLVIRKKSARMVGRIVCMAAGSVFLFLALILGGQRYERSQAVFSQSFESREAFDEYAAAYVELYNAFRAYAEIDGEDDWPKVYYGTEVIDPSYLDGRRITKSGSNSSRYERFEGVIGFDYEEQLVYKVRTCSERMAVKGQWNVISAGICLTGLAALWGGYGLIQRKEKRKAS